jgi:hypothetical protein
MAVHAQCGGLLLDGVTIVTNPTTKALETGGALLKDVVPFVSVPTTLSDLDSARTVIAELRDALVTAGVMEEEA